MDITLTGGDVLVVIGLVIVIVFLALRFPR